MKLNKTHSPHHAVLYVYIKKTATFRKFGLFFLAKTVQEMYDATQAGITSENRIVLTWLAVEVAALWWNSTYSCSSISEMLSCSLHLKSMIWHQRANAPCLY